MRERGAASATVPARICLAGELRITRGEPAGNG